MNKFVVVNIIYILYTFALYFVWLLFAMIDKNNNNLSLHNLIENISSANLVSAIFLMLMASHFISILFLIVNLFFYVIKRKMFLFKTINMMQLVNMPFGIILCMWNIAFYYTDESMDKLK